jgi:hypothetical protein
VQTVTTPSGFKAELLIQNWGPERKPAGLRYIGDRARSRLRHIFTDVRPMFDLSDISEDMKEFGFGYADDVYVSPEEIRVAAGHIFPITSIVDDVPNCLWHADRLRVNMAGEIDRIFQPQAVTMLLPQVLDPLEVKETGFGHPQIIAEAYCSILENPGDDPIVEPTSASLMEFAHAMASGMDGKGPDDPEWQQKCALIAALLLKTSEHIDHLLHKQGIHGTYWLPHQRKRLVLFGNAIVHSNDLIRNTKARRPRAQTIWRRMLPGKEFAS